MNIVKNIVTLHKTFKKKVSSNSIEKHVSYLTGRALGARRGKQGWKCVDNHKRPTRVNDHWLYEVELTFSKKSGRTKDLELVDKQWKEIVKYLDVACNNKNKFLGNPWSMITKKQSIFPGVTRYIRKVRSAACSAAVNTFFSGMITFST